MGLQQSKDELLSQQVNYGNVEGIKALHRDGAGLEWVDRDGKTPLIAACMNPELYNVAKVLIELGANVNAYRPGLHGGTPLHHAAKRGIESGVKLLLSSGANALVMNDDCQTPLDVARTKGYSNVVRAIESHICLFSGWMREFYGPGFLETLAPQLVSRKVWVVVTPCGSRNLTKPFKLELALYSRLQDAQPRIILALWKANLEESKFHQPDPTVILTHNATKTRFKLGPAKENDKEQIQWFCNACKGIPQATHPMFLQSTNTPVVPGNAPPASEDLELAMAINASVQSAMEGPSNSEAVTLTNHSWGAPIASAPLNSINNDWAAHEAGPSGKLTEHLQIRNDSPIAEASHDNLAGLSPSAPPLSDEAVSDGPIQYPSIDASPVDLSGPTVEKLLDGSGERNEDGVVSSCCVICLDAPIESACIPCGHMAGCMSCLNEIKSKKWGCPVCRAKIDQVVKLYAV